MGKKVTPEEVVKKLTAKKQPKVWYDTEGLSTGSTLLNLAISGRASWGLYAGQYYLFVGDSNSGKTFLTRAFLAEAANNPRFAKHRLVYDDVEGGALMDTRRFFGAKLADRLEPPAGTMAAPRYSETIEQFYFRAEELFRAGPCIYILDSTDSLSSKDEQKKQAKDRAAFARKGTLQDEKGSYGDGKAKKHSTTLRQLLAPLKKHGSILVIINQTRDNIGFGSQFEPKTRSGGNALEFYACAQMWSSVKQKIKKRVLGKDREVGILSRVRVKRSRITGRGRTALVPIYHNYGVDDVGCCVDWLIEERHWKGRKLVTGMGDDEEGGKELVAPEFNYKGTTEGLVKRIIEQGKEAELRALVAEVWHDIEDQCGLDRPPRYS